MSEDHLRIIPGLPRRNFGRIILRFTGVSLLSPRLLLNSLKHSYRFRLHCRGRRIKNLSVPGGMIYSFFIFLFLLAAVRAGGQILTLKEAVNTTLNNYGTIKAKDSYLKASQASAKEASAAYLPNLNLAAQQAYGTANGQFGPVIAIGGLNAASSGPPFLSQNWNAAFGGLYLANISWDFFTFGRVRENVKVAEAQVLQEASDLDQEKFQLQVRVSGAYLSLLAAQRIKLSQQKNMERADALRFVV